MNTDTSLRTLLDGLAELVASKLSQRMPASFSPSGAGSKGAVLPRLLTVEQAAVYIGRSNEAVYRMVSHSILPSVRADRRVFLDIKDLDRWIDHNKCHTD